MMNLDHITREQWADIVTRAFNAGLTDGGIKSTPMTGEDLMSCLFAGKAVSWRKGHRTKIRQVYGAGFDIAAMHKRVLEKPE